MRILPVVLLGGLVACGGGGGDQRIVVVDTGFEVGGNDGEDWPFTFAAATVRCEILTYPIPDFGRDTGRLKRPHVTIRADGGSTYGLNGAAMGRWPSYEDLIPEPWRDPTVSDEAFAFRMRANRYTADWLDRALSECFDPATGFVGPWRAFED